MTFFREYMDHWVLCESAAQPADIWSYRTFLQVHLLCLPGMSSPREVREELSVVGFRSFLTLSIECWNFYILLSESN